MGNDILGGRQVRSQASRKVTPILNIGAFVDATEMSSYFLSLDENLMISMVKVHEDLSTVESIMEHFLHFPYF